MTATTTPASRLAIIAIVLVALSIVALLPDAFVRWVLPKELVLVAAVLLAALVAPAGRLPRWLWALVGAGAAVLLVSALTGAAPVAQLLGRWPRYEGLVGIPVYVAAIWVGARLLGPLAPRARRDAFAIALAAAAALAGIVSLLEAIGLRPLPSDLSRPGSVFGNASDQGLAGLMMLILLGFALAEAVTGRRSRRLITTLAAGAVLALATVVVSASRAAIATLVLVVVVVAVIVVRAGRSRRRLLLISGGALVLIAVAVLALPLTRSRILGASPLSGGSNETRLILWREALDLIGASPLTGTGPSGFLDRVVGLHPEQWPHLAGRNVVVDAPHNWLLQLGVAGGVPLLLLGFGGAIAVLVVGVRRIRDGEPLRVAPHLLAIVAFGVVLLTHITAPATVILAGVSLGALLAVPPSPRKPSVAAVYLRPALLSVWLLAFLLMTIAELPLQQGVQRAAQDDVAGAQSAFEQAAALRPWDADIPSIAAQAFASRTEAGAPGAQAATIAWGERALAAVPDSVPTGKALAVGLQYVGRLDEAAGLLRSMRDLAPNDPVIAHRLGGILFLLGDAEGARTELERAALLDPNNAAVFETLEYVCQQLGDLPAAAEARARIERIRG